ncbi:MAG: LysR family transcriptional regulator [Rubripirellula sp.]
MNLRTLELFCTIAEQRSFSKAAAVHDLTQSAVSQAMQHLEESLGVQLIDRSKRPLVLTAAGKTYLRGLRGVLGTYHRLEQEVRSTSKQLSGRITIGTIVSVGLSYMPEATQAFSRLHPEVDVVTQYGANDRVFEMTTGGEVDFGLVSFPRNTKQLQSVLWQQEPVRLVCSSEHPLASQHEVSLSQLSGIDMIGFDRQLKLRQEIDQCLAKAGIKVNIRMEFDNADSMIRAIQANRGIGIVPEAAVRRETAIGSLRVVACRELRMTRPLGIIFRRSGRLSKAASEFGSLLLGRPLAAEKRNSSGSGKLAVDTASIGVGSDKSIVA